MRARRDSGNLPLVIPRDPLDARLTECSYWDRGDYRAALATAKRVLLPKVAAGNALIMLRGVCPACGETFDASAIGLHLDGSMRHNPQVTDETSMVVDAGGWLWIADQYLEWAHERAFKHAARERRRHDLRVAA